MFHFFVTPEQVGEKEILITCSDVNHIRNVLRMKAGDEITVSSDNTAVQYRCRIVDIQEQIVKTEIMWVEESDVELPSKICLFQGLPKGDKMELIIQKAVELGAYEILPFISKRTVVKLDPKKEEAKLRRWNAVSESAAKQSKRRLIPEVTKVMNFSEALDYAAGHYEKILIPYERAEGMEKTREAFAQIRSGTSVAVFIGPEGGFEEAEVMLAQAKGAIPVTLGRRILRTETAGLVVLSNLMMQLEP